MKLKLIAVAITSLIILGAILYRDREEALPKTAGEVVASWKEQEFIPIKDSPEFRQVISEDIPINGSAKLSPQQVSQLHRSVADLLIAVGEGSWQKWVIYNNERNIEPRDSEKLSLGVNQFLKKHIGKTANGQTSDVLAAVWNDIYAQQPLWTGISPKSSAIQLEQAYGAISLKTAQQTLESVVNLSTSFRPGFYGVATKPDPNKENLYALATILVNIASPGLPENIIFLFMWNEDLQTWSHQGMLKQHTNEKVPLWL